MPRIVFWCFYNSQFLYHDCRYGLVCLRQSLYRSHRQHFWEQNPPFEYLGYMVWKQYHWRHQQLWRRTRIYIIKKISKYLGLSSKWIISLTNVIVIAYLLISNSCNWRNALSKRGVYTNWRHQHSWLVFASFLDFHRVILQNTLSVLSSK